MKKVILILTITIITSVLLLSRTIVVGGDNPDYNSIQAAISAAENGDLITIHSGTYTENLRFSKSIQLEGLNTNRVIIKPANKKRPTILIENANRVSISGMTVHGETIAISTAMTSVEIEGNKIITQNDGIRAGTLNQEVYIRNNSIYGAYEGYGRSNTSTNGIMSVGIGKIVIENNEIKAFHNAVYLGGKKPVKLFQNQLIENNNALYTCGNTEALLIKNRIAGNTNSGILAIAKSTLVLESNLFTGNREFDIVLADKDNTPGISQNFTGSISGNSNLFTEEPKIRPEDYTLPENFIKEEE